MNKTVWVLMEQYGAALSSLGNGTFVISKTGGDDVLEELYRRLEGPHLMGFCKSGLIIEESLVSFGEW